MKIIILIATLIGVALLVSAQAEDRHIEDEIRKLNTQEVEALIHNDLPTLKRLWSDDFVVTNPFNKFVNKQQVIGMIESGRLTFTSYDRKVEYIRVYGETAVAVGSETVVWAGKMPTAGQISHLRFTHAFG